MKNQTGTARKLRYGGVTALLTAAIIAIIIILNVIFSALAEKHLWYADLTPELNFTLSEECIDLINNGDAAFVNSTSPIDKIKEFRKAAQDKNATLPENERLSEEEIIDRTTIKIILCDNKLAWDGDNDAMKYVWKTAVDLEKEFEGYIEVVYTDIIRNPSAVTKYEGTIATTSVIITCGEEYRVRSLRSFYVFSSDNDEEPWAYNGEKIFASSILAVTRADTPIACFTNNHGEVIDTDSIIVANTLVTAGYDVRWIDLSSDEPIPADCRLIIINQPSVDFMVGDGFTDINEIEKLDEFLDGTSSLMVLMSPKQEKLPNLEEYLEEWGIAFDRDANGNGYLIEDTLHSIDSYGQSITAQYVDAGLGAEITENLSAARRKVIFPQAMSISYPGCVRIETGGTEEGEEGGIYNYGSVAGDGYYREIYDLFVSSNDARAMAGGVEVESAAKGNNFKLMTISVEDHYTQESNYTTTNNASYVIATGCPNFISEDMLRGQYGNSEFLESFLRVVAQEPVPVGLEFTPFGDTDIDTIETADATAYTVILTVVPAALSMIVGLIVIVRRKNR